MEALLDNLRITHPALIKVFAPEGITLTTLQKVLQNLIREKVPVRDLVTIVETLVAHRESRDPDVLTERVREALSEAICRPHRDKAGVLKVIQLDPAIETLIEESLQPSEAGSFLAVDEGQAWQILEALSKVVVEVQVLGLEPIVLTSPPLRQRLRKATDHVFPNLIILSWNEISPKTLVRCVATVALRPAAKLA